MKTGTFRNVTEDTEPLVAAMQFKDRLVLVTGQSVYEVVDGVFKEMVFIRYEKERSP